MVSIQERNNLNGADQITGSNGKTRNILQGAAPLILILQSSKNLQEAVLGTQSNLQTSKKGIQETPSNDWANNPVLQALLESIALDGEFFSLKQDLIQSLVNYFGDQLEQVQNIKDQIDQLTKELAGNLTPEQIQSIKNQLTTLQSQYNAALSEIQGSSADKESKESDISALEKQNEELEKEAAAETDPQKKQELEDQIDQNKAQIGSDNEAITNDEGAIAQGNSQIADIQASFQSLANTYPALSNSIAGILTAIGNQQSISGGCDALTSFLNSVASDDQKLNSEIAGLNQNLADIVQDIQTHTLNLKQTLLTFSNNEDSEKAQIILESVERVGAQFVEHFIESIEKIEKGHREAKMLKFALAGALDKPNKGKSVKF